MNTLPSIAFADNEANLARPTSTALAREIIHESPHVRVVNQPSACDLVIVTFNEIGRCADGLSFWGEHALTLEGVGAIGVVSTRPNWFPRDPAMVEAIRTAITAHRYRWVVTYGHSQGGYGALKYAAALSAGTAIAFCPQWSIDHADVEGSDDRFTGYYHADLHEGMRIDATDSRRDAFICFDPRSREDSWHAARIRERIACTPVLTPFSGHSGVRFATRAGIGRSLLRILIDPATCAATRAARARRLVREARQLAAEYWLGRAKALSGSPFYAAELTRSLTEASNRAGGDAQLLAGVATVQFACNQVAAALENALRAAEAVDPAAVDTVLRIWDVMNRAGHSALSLPMLRKAVARSPDNAFLRLHLVTTLLDARATASVEAAREVELAAEYAGPSEMLWRHIENACERLGQIEGQDAARRKLRQLTGNGGAEPAQ